MGVGLCGGSGSAAQAGRQARAIHACMPPACLSIYLPHAQSTDCGGGDAATAERRQTCCMWTAYIHACACGPFKACIYRRQGRSPASGHLSPRCACCRSGSTSKSASAASWAARRTCRTGPMLQSWISGKVGAGACTRVQRPAMRCLHHAPMHMCIHVCMYVLGASYTRGFWQLASAQPS